MSPYRTPWARPERPMSWRERFAIGVAGILAGLMFCTGGCTAAQVSAFDAAIAAGSAALVPAEQLSCSAALDLDPSGGTAICAVIDAAGNAIGAGFQVLENAQAIAALLTKAPVKLPATQAVLDQTKAAIRVRAVAVRP